MSVQNCIKSRLLTHHIRHCCLSFFAFEDGVCPEGGLLGTYLNGSVYLLFEPV